MTGGWRITDLEFLVMWEMRGDRLPKPFIYTGRTPSYQEHEQWKAEARKRVEPWLDAGFDGVLDVLSKPDIRIAVNGWDSPRDEPAGPDRGRRVWQTSLRLLAARRADRAVAVTQGQGETAVQSGDFTVEEVDLLSLGDVVAARLPEAQPGRRESIALPTPSDAGLDHDYARSEVRDDTADPSWTEAAEFFGIPAARAGAIDVAQGVSRFGPAHQAHQRLAWRDLVDDGRYVLTGMPTPRAFAADTSRTAAAINAAIAAIIRSIKDQRV